ncbi:Ni,Fe-hydrogenase I large subunit [Orenia metallireducens]|uniref:Ni,Fe-hydrogenase I large subunit n=1 Tax=Orenia metallireducens TaxID=1413210 RepID=A0A1C0ABK8_9FIRM|nr:nickel-dependent hydrogenase large subunit [Orenia metallireducens]OCL27746.1 Ni,Fe-hydrogenase I large subunit [Orenia metallireducens]
MAKIKIDPVTRLEGHLKIEVEVDSTNTVINAHSSGNLFRGFEQILAGRDPRDAIHLTQRICGLCPVSHSIASVKAVEDAFGYTPTADALLLRNLILGGNYLSDHILHFYHLALLDYAQGPSQSPWQPGYNVDYRLTTTENDAVINNYIKALEIRRKAHEMTAILSGKIPHVMTVVPGGVTVKLTSTDITKFKTYLSEVKSFIDNEYMNDLNLIANAYDDYYYIGKGSGNLLTYGVFDLDSTNTLFKAGTYTNGTYGSMDTNLIKEYTKYSWYTDTSTNKHPQNGETTPQYGKAGAYSWLKAPRYNGVAYETGPLARMFMNKEYTRGISVMDRHMARGLETQKLAQEMSYWADLLSTNMNAYSELTLPDSGVGYGLTEAPRGALGHWLNFSNQSTDHYQVLTPTCWNVSPRDDNGNMGPLEQALIGVTVQDINQPIELLRIVHSFDPCTGCSVHIIDVENNIRKEFVVSTPNPKGAF